MSDRLCTCCHAKATNIENGVYLCAKHYKEIYANWHARQAACNASAAYHLREAAKALTSIEPRISIECDLTDIQANDFNVLANLIEDEENHRLDLVDNKEVTLIWWRDY